VEKCLISGHEKNIDFIVTIVDSLPKYEGKLLLKRLTKSWY
jgi:translation initiation factor 2B subunit (eIF-2B alpha/beta/delta family)